MQAFSPQIAMMDADVLTDEESVALMREFVEAMFPPPPARYARKHWFGRKRVIPQITPADVFFALPLAAQLEGISRFVQCLASALPTTGQTRNGSDNVKPGGEFPRHASGSL
jgi:hypothetical protein